MPIGWAFDCVISDWPAHFAAAPSAVQVPIKSSEASHQLNCALDSSTLYSLLVQTCGPSNNSINNPQLDASNDSVTGEDCSRGMTVVTADSDGDDLTMNNRLATLNGQAVTRSIKSPSKRGQSRRPLYSCNRCARIYSKKHSVLRHLRFECGVMPQFPCSICNQRFKHRSDRLRHERKIHGCVDVSSYDDHTEMANPHVINNPNMPSTSSSNVPHHHL